MRKERQMLLKLLCLLCAVYILYLIEFVAYFRTDGGGHSHGHSHVREREGKGEGEGEREGGMSVLGQLQVITRQCPSKSEIPYSLSFAQCVIDNSNDSSLSLLREQQRLIN